MKDDLIQVLLEALYKLEVDEELDDYDIGYNDGVLDSIRQIEKILVERLPERGE